MILIKYDLRAIRDLELIYENIFKDKESVAKNFIDKIDDFISLLSINPELGKDCRKKGLERDCRVLYFENYTILYKIYKTHISIKRVLNSKQNIK